MRGGREKRADGYPTEQDSASDPKRITISSHAA
jgi:hypothetical protein